LRGNIITANQSQTEATRQALAKGKPVFKLAWPVIEEVKI